MTDVKLSKWDFYFYCRLLHKISVVYSKFWNDTANILCSVLNSRLLKPTILKFSFMFIKFRYNLSFRETLTCSFIQNSASLYGISFDWRFLYFHSYENGRHVLSLIFFRFQRYCIRLYDLKKKNRRTLSRSSSWVSTKHARLSEFKGAYMKLPLTKGFYTSNQMQMEDTFYHYPFSFSAILHTSAWFFTKYRRMLSRSSSRVSTKHKTFYTAFIFYSSRMKNHCIL